MAHQIKFVIYKDKTKHYRWRMIAGNGEAVASSEAYASKQGAVKSANKIKITAHMALIESEDGELM